VLNATMLLNPIGLIVAGIVAGAVAFGYFWARSEMFRASVMAVWEVSKIWLEGIYTVGKKNIGGLMDIVGGLLNMWIGVYETMKAVITLDFSGIGDGLSKIGGGWLQGVKGAFNASVGTGFTAMSEGIDKIPKGYQAAKQGFAQGKTDFQNVEEANKANQLRTFQDAQNSKRNLATENNQINGEKQQIIGNDKMSTNSLLKMGATLADLRSNETYQPTTADILNQRNGKTGGGTLGSLAGGASGGGTGGSIGNVTGDSKAAKNINTTIQNLVINITVSTTNITEGTGEIKKLVGAAILDAVNDISYAGR
jgi:hypothetical protein